ncbi:MAG: cbb3-type cytochrome c oxidase subunit I [SAR202 cluster bacterium]|jgi:cytochrome c oxidase subunit 1|nr:cbb3-type cytochrome c oxidase subunit I [SAR202 cluster bacterium]
MTGILPLIKGLIFAAVGFAIGSLAALGLSTVTPQALKEPLITLGYLLAVIGWLMGVGMWRTWGSEWFGLKPIVHDNSGRWKRYFRFTTDHKVIGIQYLVTMLVIFLLAGAFGVLLRAELADGPQNIMGANDYNTVMSLHGIMMIAVAVATLIGGFANYVLPIMIGAKDVAFPRINALSYWILPPVAILLLATPLFGGFDTGWTAYPPLASQTATGALLFELAFLTFGVSSILGGINFIATVVLLRSPGMTWGRVPIFVWSVLAAAVIALIATQWIAYGLLMIILERVVGMHFFNPIDGVGGSALLYEHIFWFYSHPAVYIMVLPAFGLLLEIISTFSRKPVFAYKWVVRAFFAIVFLGFIVWAHHLFVSGMQESLHGPFMILTELISIPTGVIFLSALATMWRGKLRLTTPMLFAIGMVLNFAVGGLTGIFLADVATDIQLSETYFVVAHFHYTIVGGEIFAIFAGIYYWYPKITGKMYNETLGRIHAVLMFVTFNLTFMTMFIPGSLGMNRRVATYPEELSDINGLVSIFGYLLALSFIPFVWNIIYSLIKGRKAPSDPWKSKTLEWQTSSPPSIENFETVPTVTGIPYGYGDPTVVHVDVEKKGNR